MFGGGGAAGGGFGALATAQPAFGGAQSGGGALCDCCKSLCAAGSSSNIQQVWCAAHCTACLWWLSGWQGALCCWCKRSTVDLALAQDPAMHSCCLHLNSSRARGSFGAAIASRPAAEHTGPCYVLTSLLAAGGFAAAARQGGGFGAFGGASPQSTPASGGGGMWQMRK